MKIKSYKNHHKEDVIELILGIQQQEYNVKITAADQPDLNRIKACYQKGTGNFWVALDDECVVGTIALLDLGNQQVALRKMFVAEDYRGPKKGVARALLMRCHEWAIEQGITDIYLGTIDVYQAAMRFYEKNGYRKIKKTELPTHFPLIEVDNVFYHRRLSKACFRSQ